MLKINCESNENFYFNDKAFQRNVKDVKNRKVVGRAWMDKVNEKCPGVRFIAHYALPGKYDFLDIYEAPDEETAGKSFY